LCHSTGGWKLIDESTLSIEEIAPDFTYVDTGRRFPEAPLMDPTSSGYLLSAADVDRRPMFLPDSRRKRRVVRDLKQAVSTLRTDERVIEVNVFDGILAAARPGKILEERPGVPTARFDVAVLLEASSPATATELEREETWTQVLQAMQARSRTTYRLRAHNIRRMGPVDHSTPGVFLINYFYADRTDLNLAAWQYTAGWFHDQKGPRQLNGAPTG
jgi:hypothetical protein